MADQGVGVADEVDENHESHGEPAENVQGDEALGILDKGGVRDWRGHFWVCVQFEMIVVFCRLANILVSVSSTLLLGLFLNVICLLSSIANANYIVHTHDTTPHKNAMNTRDKRTDTMNQLKFDFEKNKLN